MTKCILQLHIIEYKKNAYDSIYTTYKMEFALSNLHTEIYILKLIQWNLHNRICIINFA